VSGYLWTRTAVPNLLSGLVGDVNAALATTTLGRTDRAIVAPGVDIAWDNCQCGQLAAFHKRTYRSRNFPQDATDQFTKCDNFTVVFDLSMTLVRCVAIMSDNGVPPKPAQVLADLQNQEEDAYVLWTTLDCSLRELQAVNLVSSYIINQETTLGPQGGCAGTQVDFKLSLYPPCPCEG
jgi:hypothetical protein